MGRDRVSKKFSFPLPRRSKVKVDDNDHHHSARSTPSIPSVPEWPSTSKAHRVLGTSDSLYRSPSNQPSAPASPGYMSITVSEASFGSHLDGRSSATATENGGYLKLPGMSKRASSNILGRAYSGDGRRGSDNSSVSHRLQPQTSNSTMRSHYDAKSSPLAISQQTSDSAVRDRALRRGQPQVVTEYGYNQHVASPMSPMILDEANKKENRRSKPARLDLSKLFPKPKTGDGQDHAHVLLSPTKMVNSPAAMSMASDYFPRPMTREPTPQIGGQVKLKTATSSSTTRYQQPTMQPAIQPPSSPVRKFRKDDYDNAKIHVRRPPKGVQHWFDALDEDSDEATADARTPIYAPKAVRPQGMPKVPVRKTSLGRLHSNLATTAPPSQYLVPTSRKDTFAHEDIADIACLTSPSQFSVNSLVSNKTKESSLSKSNLQDSSVLSFSSSEEDEYDQTQAKARKFAVRKSLDINDDAGEVIIGQAQAFEVRPKRRPSAGRISTRSTSTGAATIEVMYSPEPPFPSYHFPRSSNYSGSKRSGHLRQPSVIPEVEDDRPKTAVNIPLSPSTHSITSARTSASEPKPRSDGSHKLMAVTAEEEALLEMMRKKRAAMAKKGLSQVDQTLAEQDKSQKTPTEASHRRYRTSGFLSMEASPVRGLESKNTRRASAVPPSPLLLPPRGRPLRALHESNPGMSQFRDSSASDTWSDRHHSPVTRTVLPHHLPTPSEFSPLDPFPPSTPSVTSPTTIDNASPLPSPVTPGLRTGDIDVAVKVANSETSSNNSEDVAILNNGVIGAPPDSVKSDSSSHHQRRRTASSAADIAFPTPPTKALRDLAAVSETSSRPPSVVEPPLPKVQRRNSRRISGLTLSTNGHARSRQSSVHSTNSRTSTHSQTSGYFNGMEKRSSRHLSRGNSVASARGSRNSVSDDVLAAWNSLGGSY